MKTNYLPFIKREMYSRIILFLILAGTKIKKTNSQCSDAYSCALSTLTSTTVDCYGYYSCTQAQVGFGNSITYANCHGSFSCYEAGLLQQELNNGGSAECFGLYSCALCASIVTRGVLCRGELSCYQSIIMQSSSTHCNGDKSCMNANITNYLGNNNNAYNYMFGYLSGYGASFDGIYGDNFNYWYTYFYGMNSGNDARITCQDGVTRCYVYCLGNACNNLTLACSGNSTCSFTYVNSLQKYILCTQAF